MQKIISARRFQNKLLFYLNQKQGGDDTVCEKVQCYTALLNVISQLNFKREKSDPKVFILNFTGTLY